MLASELQLRPSFCLQRTGEVCAIKVFAEQLRPAIMQAKTRELELMTRLKHVNIVKFLAIEQEVNL